MRFLSFACMLCHTAFVTLTSVTPLWERLCGLLCFYIYIMVVPVSIVLKIKRLRWDANETVGSRPSLKVTCRSISHLVKKMRSSVVC